MVKNQNWESLPLVLTLTEVCEILGLCRPVVSQMLQNGELPSRKCGNRWLIERDKLIMFLRGEI